MLNNNLKERIKSMDALTDFDDTIIPTHMIYRHFWNNFSHLPLDKKLKVSVELFEALAVYKSTGNLFGIFSLFQGYSDEEIKQVHCQEINPLWASLAMEHDYKNIGIVSRNARQFIELPVKEINNLIEGLHLEIIVANELEFVDGVCTGESEIFVNENTLWDMVKDKPYICGRDELKLFKKKEVPYVAEKIDYLFICSK